MKNFCRREKNMKKLLSFFLILVIFANAASAADISGNVSSFGKKLADLKVTLNSVTGTQNQEGGMVYNFTQLSETSTDQNGEYGFSDLNDGMYRVNVTYNSITYGENTGLKGKAVIDFNLSEKIEGYVLKLNKTLEGIPIRLIDETG